MTEKTISYIAGQALMDIANRNYGTLIRQLKGLSHEDSLCQLPFRGNCLNWIVGHITQSRDRMLQLVDAQSVWTAAQIEHYARESAPVMSDADAFKLEDILAGLALMHERLVTRIAQLAPDDLDAPGKEVVKNAGPMNVGEFLEFLLWHETYHIGQTEMLRQLAGTNDKVI